MSSPVIPNGVRNLKGGILEGRTGFLTPFGMTTMWVAR